MPDSSRHPQCSLSCSSTAQSQLCVIASQPWILPGTPLSFPLPLWVPSTAFLTAPDLTNIKAGKKMKTWFQLTFASTHKFSPFHLHLITVIPKWPKNELSISCAYDFQSHSTKQSSAHLSTLSWSSGLGCVLSGSIMRMRLPGQPKHTQPQSRLY